MRKENIGNNNARVENSRVQSYHEGGYSCSDSERYAYLGYKTNKYFTSDRYTVLDENFNRPDGKPLKGYGLEIETECNGITRTDILANILEKIVFKTFPDGLFKMQHDGSLGGSTSAECITQVMTKEFIRNNYKNFKTMYNDYFPMFGITAQNQTCGMHVNISLGCFGTTKKAQDEAIRKVFYIINKHYDFWKVAFNRTNSTFYSGRINDTKEHAKSMVLERQSNDHTKCLNYSHYRAGRIEIRLVGGQKDYGCFRNTMETIFHLVERSKTISWNDCDSLTEIFKGCNSYVFDRLNTNCRNKMVISLAELDAIAPTVEQVRYL